MTIPVYISFDFLRDFWMVDRMIRIPDIQPVSAVGFRDASRWEEALAKGEDAVKAMIAAGLEESTLTIVCLGLNGEEKPWVGYEIEESVRRGHGVIGVLNVPKQKKKPMPCGSFSEIPCLITAKGGRIIEYDGNCVLLKHIKESLGGSGRRIPDALDGLGWTLVRSWSPDRSYSEIGDLAHIIPFGGIQLRIMLSLSYQLESFTDAEHRNQNDHGRARFQAKLFFENADTFEPFDWKVIESGTHPVTEPTSRFGANPDLDNRARDSHEYAIFAEKNGRYYQYWNTWIRCVGYDLSQLHIEWLTNQLNFSSS